MWEPFAHGAKARGTRPPPGRQRTYAHRHTHTDRHRFVLEVLHRFTAFTRGPPRTRAHPKHHQAVQAAWEQIWAHHRQYFEGSKIKHGEITEDDNLVRAPEKSHWHVDWDQFISKAKVFHGIGLYQRAFQICQNTPGVFNYPTGEERQHANI